MGHVHELLLMTSYIHELGRVSLIHFSGTRKIATKDDSVDNAIRKTLDLFHSREINQCNVSI